MRFVGKLRRRRPEVADVMEHPPGQEARVDYFQGQPTLDPATGRWRKPWMFRMTLSCSRHGYTEPMWTQDRRAFASFSGVPKVVSHDNLKAAVVRACLYPPSTWCRGSWPLSWIVAPQPGHCHSALKPLTAWYASGRMSTLNVEVQLPESSRRARAEQKRFLTLIVNQLALAVTTMRPRLIALLIDRLQETKPPLSAEDEAFIATITGGKTYSQTDAAVLEATNLVQSYQRRRELLAGAVSTADVARLLGVGRQTPNDRVKARSLLAVHDNGVLRFPAWQFDPAGEHGVVRGLPAVLRELAGHSALAITNWMTKPNSNFSGDTPLTALRAGKLDAVLAAARVIETY